MGDEKHNIHCGVVIEACLGMINNTNLEKDIFIISGWIHDMGKLDNKADHHIASIKYLDEFLNDNEKYKKWDLELRDSIINHRSDGNPKTIYGRILKLADKIALCNIKWLEYKKKIKKDKI